MCLCCLDLPSNPEILHVVGTAKGQVTLQWQPAEETKEAPVKEYVIEMAIEGSDDFKEIAAVDSDSNKFDVKGLKDGQKYNFRIRGQNQAGTSQSFAELEKAVTASAIGKRECLDNRLNLLVVSMNAKFPILTF